MYRSHRRKINKAIKATAQTIIKTKLSDKIHSEDILKRANLRCLNESVGSIIATTVWQSKQSMNAIGQCLFSERTNQKSIDQLVIIFKHKLQTLFRRWLWL